MHDPWLRGEGDILIGLFTFIIIKMTINDHSDRRRKKVDFMCGTKSVQIGPETTVRDS